MSKAKGITKANQIVREAIKNSPSPAYIALDTFCPWKRIVIEETEAKFIVYPSTNGNWNIQTIPINLEDFTARKNLPEPWAGLTDQEFADKTGVKDAVFCHKGLFIAAAKTKEGALALLDLALNQ